MSFSSSLSFRLGLIFAAISFVCGILLYAAPGATAKVLGYLVHSTLQFNVKPFDAASFAMGIIAWFVIGAIIGFAWKSLCSCCREEKKKK